MRLPYSLHYTMNLVLESCFRVLFHRCSNSKIIIRAPGTPDGIEEDRSKCMSRTKRLSWIPRMCWRPLLVGFSVLAAMLMIAPARASAEAIKVVFDTDISSDVDDCGALAILNN